MTALAILGVLSTAIFSGVSVGTALAMVVGVFSSAQASRLMIALDWLLTIVLVLVGRWAVHGVEVGLRLRGIGEERVLIVGSGDTARLVLQRIRHSPQMGYRPVGFVADQPLVGELDGLANRGYTAGFYERHPEREMQNYLKAHSDSGRSLYVGDVLGYDAAGRAEINVKNRFAVGDRIELIHPSGNRQQVIGTMLNEEGEAVSVAPGSGYRVRIDLPAGCDGGFLARFV